MFVRVVHRRGWDVELVEEERTLNFPDREAALEFARGQEPDWIEVGEVVTATAETPQHHRWHTLRRRPGGGYAETGLHWGGRPG